MKPAPTANAKAVILDESLQPFTTYGTYDVKTVASIYLDDFRPRLELVSKLERSQLPRNNTKLDSLAERFEESVDLVGQDKEITIAFTSLSFCLTWNVRATEKHDTATQNALHALPNTTKNQVALMSAPLIMEFKACAKNVITNIALGCPPWASKVHKVVVEQENITFLVDEQTAFAGGLQKLTSILKSRKDPLDRFHIGENGDSYTGEDFVEKPIFERPLGFFATNDFCSTREYLTVFNAGARLDRAEEVRKIKAYESSKKNLILVRVNVDLHCLYYYGLITGPEKHEYPLQPGDTLELKLDHRTSNPPKWQATVMESPTIRRQGYLPVLVHRGQYWNSSAYDEYTPPGVIDGSSLSKSSVISAVACSNGNSVSVRIVDCDSVYAKIAKSYDVLNAFREGRGDSAEAYLARATHLLTGKQPQKLPVKDLYGAVANSWPNGLQDQAFMGVLNTEQSRVICASRKLLGGLQIVQGPPGTGKTYLLQQMVAPFLISSIEDSLVLVSAPSNHGVDDLAEGICTVLDGLQNRFKLPYMQNRYVLRLHSLKAELEISRTQGPRAPVPPTANTSASLTTASRAAPFTEFMLDHNFGSIAAAKFEGIYDRRVQRVDYSVGYMMLQISGVVPSTPYADKDPEQYKEFRTIYARRVSGRPLTAGQQLAWERDCGYLFHKALLGASAIVGTTAGLATTLPIVQDRTQAVFLDENAFEREDSLAPFFAANFVNDPCIVLIGDHRQLKPATKEPWDNQFKAQLELSFMQRMINLGHDHIMLTKQYRMVRDLVALPNKITYNGQLTNDLSTALSSRPIARTFREFAAKYLDGKESNRMMINVPPGLENDTRKNSAGSKGNDFFVCVVETLVKELLNIFKNDATIAILTPYKYQRSKYALLLGAMRNQRMPNLEMLVVDTFDGAQGREYDIVIVDLPVKSFVGFLQDEKRMNVAMSRARDGLIVVCNELEISEALRRARSWHAYPQHLETLMKMFRSRTWNRPRKDDFPETEYFKPTYQYGD